MSQEQILLDRLAADQNDIAAIIELCTLLVGEGRPVPPDIEEASLRHYLSLDATRHDLAFRLSNLLMEQQRAISPELEESALRHCLKAYPHRQDIYERFTQVALENGIATAPPLPQPGLAADVDPGPIMARARARLMQLRAQPAREDLPSYGVRWGEFARRMHEAAACMPDPAAATAYAQFKINFEHRLPRAAALRDFPICMRELSCEFPQYIEQLKLFDDSPLSDPSGQFVIAGRRLSNIAPYLARNVMSCLAAVSPAPRVITEIGGGYGGPARAWLTNAIARPETYIIIDIAESLFFSDVFLSATFGAEEVHYVADAQPLSQDVIDRCKIILCPPENIEALNSLSIDLVINTGSMQEMSPDWVLFYMNWLDRQNVRFFYSLNYFGQPTHQLSESVNLWSPHPSRHWLARMLRWNPAFIRMQADRNYLEGLYEKVTAELDLLDARSRLALLAERRMTGENLVESLDIFRRCSQPEIALGILRRIMSEMSFYPKEALWLAEWLLADRRLDHAGHIEEVSRYAALLTELRSGGVEGTV
ncbi:putative sugar O-methyltransferase [Bosea sp. RAC05]|uniref:putative sugar O-methyltransferase n=1 Tax=unclassified Bosea (in: a-proteobacteria) TaxID=2653178 RepID=UPI00083E2693|nr:putative sugar O-methyltransferase [Bosea sp. RAC05]AOG05267.1 sugar O-methyltransferase family protein [Bosea sp. RAC05]